MVSNLSVKSAFDGSRMEVGKYSPSLLMSEYLSANLIGAIIKSGICMYKKKNKNKKKRVGEESTLFCTGTLKMC